MARVVPVPSCLLVLTGFETDLGLIRSLRRAAATVAAGSVLAPFALGLGLGLGAAYLLPANFVGEGQQRTTFALFLATALSISSLPVIAKILTELGLMRRTFGQCASATAPSASGRTREWTRAGSCRRSPTGY